MFILLGLFSELNIKTLIFMGFMKKFIAKKQIFNCIQYLIFKKIVGNIFIHNILLKQNQRTYLNCEMIKIIFFCDIEIKLAMFIYEHRDSYV